MMMSKVKLLILLLLSINIISDVQSKELKDNPLVHYTGINIGTTTIFTNYTTMHIGLNYELKKFKGKYGIGFFSDFQFGPHFETLIGFPLYFHKLFNTDFYLMGAPGIGFISSLNYARYNQYEDDDFKGVSNRANLLIRFGTGYDIPIFSNTTEIMRIVPYLNFDIIAQYKTYMTFGITAQYYIF